MTVYSLTETCSSCGGRASHGFGESIIRGERVGWESWHCPCQVTKADGPLTDELREHALRISGAFRVDVYPKSKIEVLRVLRSTFELSLPEAARAFERMPRFESERTRTEAEWSALQFPPEAADVRIVADSGNAELDAARNAVSPLTLKQLRALFAHEGIDELIEMIGRACLELSRNHAVIERIGSAMVRVGGGRVSALREAIELAKVDWRDLLVIAGFAEDASAHLAWEPSVLLDGQRKRWARGDLFRAILFRVDQRVVGPNGASTVVGLVTLEPEPIYVVRGPDGVEREAAQRTLHPDEARD